MLRYDPTQLLGTRVPQPGITHDYGSGTPPVGFIWVDSGNKNLFYSPNIADIYAGTLPASPIYTATGTLNFACPCLGNDGYIYFIEKNTTKRIKRIKADDSDGGVATELWDSGSTGSGEGSLDHHPSGFLFFSVDSGNTKGRMDPDGGNRTLYNVGGSMESVRWIDESTAIGRYGYWFNVFDAVAGSNDYLLSRGATHYGGEVDHLNSKIWTIRAGTDLIYSCNFDLTGFAASYDFNNVVGATGAQYIQGIETVGTAQWIWVTLTWSGSQMHLLRFNLNDFTDYTDFGPLDVLLGALPASDTGGQEVIRIAA